MKCKKILFVIIILAILGTTLCVNATNAFDPTQYKIDYNPNDAKNFMNLGSQIIGIIQVFAVVTLAIMLVVTGIKIMYASPDGKAEIKKHAIPYMIGAVLIFATSSLVSIVIELSDTLNK